MEKEKLLKDAPTGVTMEPYTAPHVIIVVQYKKDAIIVLAVMWPNKLEKLVLIVEERDNSEKKVAQIVLVEMANDQWLKMGKLYMSIVIDAMAEDIWAVTIMRIVLHVTEVAMTVIHKHKKDAADVTGMEPYQKLVPNVMAIEATCVRDATDTLMSR